jgi:hypothetical protein
MVTCFSAMAFKQRTLHLSWRTVDLISKQDIGKNGALLGSELPTLGIEDHGTNQIRGQ